MGVPCLVSLGFGRLLGFPCACVSACVLCAVVCVWGVVCVCVGLVGVCWCVRVWVLSWGLGGVWALFLPGFGRLEDLVWHVVSLPTTAGMTLTVCAH